MENIDCVRNKKNRRDKLLWVPSFDEINGENNYMIEFVTYLIDRYPKLEHQLCLSDLSSLYHRLHKWSIENYNFFWLEFYKFIKIASDKEPQFAINEDVAMGQNPDWFPDIKMNYTENLLRRGRDKDIAILSISQGLNRMRQRTYQQLRSNVFQIASALQEAGLCKGDAVSAYLPNTIETVELMLATLSIGCIWSSTGTEFGHIGVSDRISQVKPKIIFFVTSYQYKSHKIDMLEKNERLLESLEVKPTHVVYVPNLEWFDESVVSLCDISLPKNVKGTIDYKLEPIREDQEKDTKIQNTITLLIEAKIKNTFQNEKTKVKTWYDFINIPESKIRHEYEMVPFRHPAYVLFSSGTSGKPKCIVHSGGGTLIKHAEEHLLQLNMRPKDRMLFFTSVGWMMWNWLVGGLFTGASIVLYEGCSLESDVWQVIEKVGVTILGVGAAWLDVVRKADLDFSLYNLSRIHTILSTGSPLFQENFEFVYDKINRNVLLGSISGGTDMIGCCVGCSPLLPVHMGQIQCPFLGMDVRCMYSDVSEIDGYYISKTSSSDRKGELVIAKPFPSVPVKFLNDPNDELFTNAYFYKSKKFWVHGDYLSFDDETKGITIFGRSDAVLNPKGVRFGSGEIYTVVSKIEEVEDSLCIGQQHGASERVILFYTVSAKLKSSLTKEVLQEVENKIKSRIRSSLSVKHLPELYFNVSAIPYTQNNKKVEIPMKKLFNGSPREKAFENLDTLKNPQVISEYERILARI